MSWLSRLDNRDQLIIFDNVNRESGMDNTDPYAYNVTHYLPGADYGSALITTRLANLEQLGGLWKLGRLSKEQIKTMFQSQYGGSCSKIITLQYNYVVYTKILVLTVLEQIRLRARSYLGSLMAYRQQLRRLAHICDRAKLASQNISNFISSNGRA